MASYAAALKSLATEAQHQHPRFRDASEKRPPTFVSGRITKNAVRSPTTTPKFDTSAMDGYALNSANTASATPESPAVFLIKGIMGAGDEPIAVTGDGADGVYPCVEIMTGARFPEPFDCCVKLEDTERFTDGISGEQYVKVTKPAKQRQHWRFAGADLKQDEIIIEAEQVVTPAHIMAMASVGITDIEVLRRPRIAVFSTGSELQRRDASRPNLHRINDANGPYLTAVLGGWGEVEFLDVLEDEAMSMAESLRFHLSQKRYDVVISTGAVSTGKFDTIPASLQRLGARVVFHGLAIRPGHPALFGAIPREDQGREMAYFGLPGNPVATAACLRFLVSPYLRFLQGQQLGIPLKARIRADDTETTDGIVSTEEARLVSTFPSNTDVFRPGILIQHATSESEVILIRDHSPGKIKPFAASNCWIHIHRECTELRDGDTVDIFPN